MEKILILDSNSLMNRAFYAIPELTTNEGVHTNAIYGFMNMLFKMKEEINPEYIVATFDKKGPTFRHKEFEEYKAGRKKMPPELAEQFPLVKELLGYLGISVFEMDGFEADDIIGTLAKTSEARGMEVFVVTGDRDALQLASKNINVIITKKGVSETAVYNEESFIKEYEVTPTQFIDVKGLMGDKSDNIPGVPGVGEKTAFKLIKTYGTIEAVLDNIDEIPGKKLKENLENNREQAIFSKKLATIIIDIPAEFELKKLEENNLYNIDSAKKLIFKLQLKSLVDKLGVASEEEIREDVEYIEINNINDIDLLLKEIKNNIYVTYTTNGSSMYHSLDFKEITILADKKVFIIDFDNIDNKEECISKLAIIMKSEDIVKNIHNAKVFITIFNKYGVDVNGLDIDTCVVAYLIDSSKGKYPIISLINEYLGIDIKGEGKTLSSNIIAIMPELVEFLENKLENDNMRELYYTIEKPLIQALSTMEQVGFKVNEQMLEELAIRFREDIIKTETEIYELAEEKFNINSPKQLGKILFEKMDLPVIKKTKTGYSTNAEVLEKLMDKHDIIPKIIYYRQITKLNSTYVEGLKNVIDKDGAIHSSFNQTVTTTGRLSSTEPNLQNIPIKYEMGREIRKVFIPKEENDIIMSCDYSQIELRVLAHMSQDINMIEGYTKHADIHTKTASEVFNVPIEKVDSIMRSRAKAVNFGIVYGISDFSLSQDIGVTKAEAKEYMEIYFSKYPKIKGYLESTKEEAKEKGYVLTMFNRRRFIPEIKSSNKIVKALGERLAMNAPIQGSAADIIKLAMINVHDELNRRNFKSEIILQVHDELILNVKENELEEVKILVREQMENVVKDISVPLEVDINIGKTWYEAK